MGSSKAAAKKRREVMASKEFQTWFAARMTTPPVPSDPYRAFMIDRSLNAKLASKTQWQGKPNRLDNPFVDFPAGHFPAGTPIYAPAQKPKRRKGEKYKSPELPKDPIERMRVLNIERMTTRHGVATPSIFKVSGITESYARAGIGRYVGVKDSPLVRVGVGEVHIGKTKGTRSTVQAVAVDFHEAGHVIHAQRTFSKKRLEKGILPYKGTESSYTDEQAATRLARKELKKVFKKQKGAVAVGSWSLAYGLHTYRKGWKNRGKPVVIDPKTQKLLSGGEF